MLSQKTMFHMEKNRMNKIIYEAALMSEKKNYEAALMTEKKMFCSASTVVRSVVSFCFICDLIKAIKWAFSRNTLLTDPWEISDLQCNPPPPRISWNFQSWIIPPSLLISSWKMPSEFQKSCPWYGMDVFWTWLCRTSYKVLHEVHTVMSLLCTVMQKWSFSVMKFMQKCLRNCPSKS